MASSIKRAQVDRELAGLGHAALSDEEWAELGIEHLVLRDYYREIKEKLAVWRPATLDEAFADFHEVGDSIVWTPPCCSPRDRRTDNWSARAAGAGTCIRPTCARAPCTPGRTYDRKSESSAPTSSTGGARRRRRRNRMDTRSR